VEGGDFFGTSVVFVESSEDGKTGGRRGMGCEPARSFGDEEEEEKHREEEDALQDAGNAPCDGGGVGLREAVVDPVGEEDS